jgi:hypothetical protein
MYGFSMPEEDADPMVRKTVSLRQSEWKNVELYKRHERLGSEAEAVRRLVHDQLKAVSDAARKASR